MDEHGGGGGSKVTGIRQIVRLKELLNKWQNVTLSTKLGTSNNSIIETSLPSNNIEANFRGGISPAITKRLMMNVGCDSDDESCHSPDTPPHGVPKGYLAVYVGSEEAEEVGDRRRFIIPTSYLSDPLFKVLLEKVEEEFGFDHTGGLTIPCEIETFKYLLQCMENHQRDHHHRGVLNSRNGSAGSSLVIEG